MTIASELSKVAYSGNGATLEFTVPFHFVKESDIKVVLREVGDQETLLVAGTDYSLEWEEGTIGGTCNMVTPPATGETLVVWRDPALLQETVFEEGVPLSAKAREDALDTLTMITQANRERLDRAVTFKVSSVVETVEMPDPDVGKAIIWNAAGDNLENGPTASDIETAQASAVAAETAKTLAQAAKIDAEAAQVAAELARDEAQAVAGSDASTIVFDPTGSGLTATDVDAALKELDTDVAGKAASIHTHTLSDITDAGTAAGVDTGITEGDVPVLDVSGKLAEGVIPDIGGGWEFLENITANKTFDASGYSALIVIVCGGGGRSPSTTGAAYEETAGGAGAGGSVRGLIDSPASSYVCTIGAGATAANTSGETTSFGAAISCTGGSPGRITTMDVYKPPARAGLNGSLTLDASVTQLAIGGHRAEPGHQYHGGNGGDTLLAGGGNGARTSAGADVSDGEFGSGGGGGCGYPAATSGNGGNGIIQVWGKV